MKSLNNRPVTYSASPSIYHILALLFPQTGARSGLGHLASSSSRWGAHLWRGSLYQPLGMNSYEMPTPKHVPSTLPELPGPCVGLVELQQVEKTINTLFHCQLWKESLVLTKRQNVLRENMFQHPLCKLIFSIPSRRNKTKQSNS